MSRLSLGKPNGQAVTTRLARFPNPSFFPGATMAKRHIHQKQQEGETAEKPTQKRALAEALRHLGPNATHSALARFVKERFGMELTFCILVPKAGTVRKLASLAAPRKRCA
jgi:hypothetical protein